MILSYKVYPYSWPQSQLASLPYSGIRLGWLHWQSINCPGGREGLTNATSSWSLGNQDEGCKWHERLPGKSHCIKGHTGLIQDRQRSILAPGMTLVTLTWRWSVWAGCRGGQVKCGWSPGWVYGCRDQTQRTSGGGDQGRSMGRRCWGAPSCTWWQPTVRQPASHTSSHHLKNVIAPTSD